MKKLLRHPRYLFLVLTIACVVYLTSIWAGDLRFLARIYADTKITNEKFIPLAEQLLLTSLQTAPMERVVPLALTAILVGLIGALFVLYVRTHGALPGHSGTASGVVGGIASVLGVGCAACGSLVLTSLFGVGSVGALSLLPYQGAEIEYVGIFLLTLSAFLLHRALSRPRVC